jgi:uncharacterized membrane protein
MLIVIPLGLLAVAVVFDILYFISDNSDLAIAAFWMIIAGILGGLLAAIFGFLDWLNVPSGTRAKTVGLTHGVGNVVVVLLFALSWFMRLNSSDYVPTSFAFILALAGALLAVFTAWLGGELVYRMGLAVDPGAHPDAPSSLSGQPASGKKTG